MQLHIFRMAIGFHLSYIFLFLYTSDSFLMKVLIWVLVWSLLDLYTDNSQTFLLKKWEKVDVVRSEKLRVESRFKADIEKQEVEIEHIKISLYD